ncbi:MAG: cyclic nucleotide-binding domain-containing protein [Ectothiorhodospiraceae bacterium]|nr:cyclic nucleotide-binding domain-containing protein [Ectothiorhodospiraceae bacterium]
MSQQPNSQQIDGEQEAECESIVDSSLGQELEKDECQILTTVMGTRSLNDGEVLVKEGDAENTLFILTQGKLIVSSKVEGKEVAVYAMKVGECAGTRAFVDLAPRKATLTAEGDSTVYTLEPENFESLLDSHPRIVYKIMRGLFRLTHMNLMRMNVETQELSNYINKSGGRY